MFWPGLVHQKAAIEMMLIPTLKLAANKYHEEAAALKAEGVVEEKKARQLRYKAKEAGAWALNRDTRGASTMPLLAVLRNRSGPQGQPKGTITTDPKEIDEIARTEYGKIYKGNVADQRRHADAYLENYREYILEAPPFEADYITGEDLMEAARNSSNTAAGMDQWKPAELKLFSKEAMEMLAIMLNMVERTGKWPTAMTQARAAFLAKDPEDTQDVLNYRVLLMLSSVYRLWSKVRLAHLRPWIDTWATPEMFAGIEGKSAADAAYCTAIATEWHTMQGEH